MKENNNILIIVDRIVNRDDFFRYITSILKDGICTYYGQSYDIKTKTKHIKITCYDDEYKYNEHFPIDKPDIIILDMALDTDKHNKEIKHYQSVTDNLIYIDIDEIIHSWLVREVKGEKLNIID